MVGHLQIAISLAGLERRKDAPWGATARETIEWAARIGARRVVLDATMPGVRPRELDRSARRDLASVLRRLGLDFAGIDLWIPPTHMVAPAHLDRAIEAVEAAIGMCSELAALGGGSGRVLNTALPESLAVGVGQRLAACAERAGVVVADHAVKRGMESMRHSPMLAAGIDPAAVLAAGLEPVAIVANQKEPVASARWTDLGSAGRVVAGSRGGRLDIAAYLASLQVNGYRGPMIGDVRNMTDQAQAAQLIIASQTRE